MKYTVVCVGKLKERFWKDACAEYTKRLGAYAKVDIREVADIDPAKAGGVDAARDKEGAAILAALPPRAHVILLAIEGKERSSEELSARLDDLMLRGNSDIAFVIGGSDGVSDDVAHTSRRDAQLWTYYLAAQLGARGAAGANLPRLQDQPWRAVSQIGRQYETMPWDNSLRFEERV